jgi:hypothetical protein
VWHAYSSTTTSAEVAKVCCHQAYSSCYLSTSTHAEMHKVCCHQAYSSCYLSTSTHAEMHKLSVHDMYQNCLSYYFAQCSSAEAGSLCGTGHISVVRIIARAALRELVLPWPRSRTKREFFHTNKPRTLTNIQTYVNIEVCKKAYISHIITNL